MRAALPTIALVLACAQTALARRDWSPHLRSPFNAALLARDDPFPRWCGKHYQVGSPADSDDVTAGLFPVPAVSEAPLLDFRCTPTIQPYLPGDSVSFLLDANVTHDVGQPASTDLHAANQTLSVTITLTNFSTTLVQDVQLPIGTLGLEVPISLPTDGIPVSATAYAVSCVATLGNDTFTHAASLYTLPPSPYGGSTTKIDRRTGALLRQDGDGAWTPFLPFGFYTFVDDLMTNLSIIDAMAADGYNVIHLVPSYHNASTIEAILDHADSQGILYMADFRDIYTNLSAVEPYVEIFRQRKNFMLWYTADEQDGPNDDPAFTTEAYDLFYAMDGYHPVSFVLNCLNFHWNDYVAGTDIVFADVYPIAVNTTFSKRYDTPCNATYGCCGCDDCTGDLTDIPAKIDLWSEYRRWLGRGRTLAIWNVPQAFNGTDEFWDRVPTGAEFQVQTVLGLNHGAVGVMPWDNPYDTPGIAQGAREIAALFEAQIGPLVLAPGVARTVPRVNVSAVDVAVWAAADNGTTLVMLANLAGEPATVAVETAAAAGNASVKALWGSEPAVGEGELVARLEGKGIGVYVLSS